MIEISLTFSCGCREVMPAGVASLNGNEQHATTANVCPSECWVCAADGLCDIRKAMPPAYKPVEFVDVRPRRHTRLKLA